MEISIDNFLHEHRVKGVRHSHVSMGQMKGKYEFNRPDLEIFWKLYMNTIKDNINHNKQVELCIAEKPTHYLPILGDIDIKIKETDSNITILHTNKQVHEIIQIYQHTIKEIVEDCTDDKLICVLLEKPLYKVCNNGTYYLKHGFHLHFPNCFLNKIDQEIHFIPRVQKMVTELKIFSSLGIEDSGKLIDKACCTVPWLLYGSKKDTGMDPYLMSKIYDSNLKELTIEEAFKNYKIFDIKEKQIKIKGNVEYYLPRILSIIPYGRETCEVQNGLISPLKEQISLKSTAKEYKTTSVIESLNIAKKLLPLLSTSRAENRTDWLTIGWVLYNIGNGTTNALDLWCDFSARSVEKYNESVCIHTWERMVKKNIGIGTLKHYAKIDNINKYNELVKETTNTHINESLNGSHNDIAKILHSLYSDQFVCSNISSKCWYQFKDNKWDQIDDGVFLREKISGEIVDMFNKIGNELFKKVSGSGDKGEEAMHSVRLKQANKMISNLKSAPFKNNVMKECQEVFYDKNFKDKLDTNPNIFPFKNGVYDLLSHEFRQCGPEDYISKTAPIDYIEFKEDDEHVQNVYDYLEKVFPDKSIRDYFLDTTSDIFMGGNHQKHAYFWTGEGDNGKSITQNILERMLGPLSIKFNTSILTGKKIQSGSANPEMARAGGGVRLATLEEPNNDESINVGILKLLTGNDTFYARDLFEKGKEGREITPMFKLIFICNILPKLKGADKATWNRIRVIPFESTFCRPDNPAPDTYEEQLRQKRFPMDLDFSSKIQNLLQPFAWLLLQHRMTIKDRVEPDKVRAATAMYRKQNDLYRQFIEESIIEDSKSYVSIVELYSHFKEWFKDSLPNQTLPIKNEVEDYFTKMWDEPLKGKRWKGYRIRTLQDDIELGDAVVLNDSDLVDYNEESMILA